MYNKFKGAEMATAAKRILVLGTDGGLQSNYALEYMTKHVYREGDYVYVVYCPKLRMQQRGCSDLANIDKEKASKIMTEEKNMLDTEVRLLQDNLDELKIKGEIIIGNPDKRPAEALLETAKAKKAVMIIIGSRGVGKVQREITGSTSDDIILNAHVPVLVCKA
ncbi:uncharacterized protein LOC121390457 [Gigantopelta aegis]|uniref:uncharacterized protein LOC121390457 n=1 Tax=Gigantopelta aegis TaxID=1735272 RepID=UPI001B88B7D7|nr:uncharacterized protein LOC121390457 [Gigantopelta aegis]